MRHVPFTIRAAIAAASALGLSVLLTAIATHSDASELDVTIWATITWTLATAGLALFGYQQIVELRGQRFDERRSAERIFLEEGDLFARRMAILMAEVSQMLDHGQPSMLLQAQISQTDIVGRIEGFGSLYARAERWHREAWFGSWREFEASLQSLISTASAYISATPPDEAARKETTRAAAEAAREAADKFSRSARARLRSLA